MARSPKVFSTSVFANQEAKAITHSPKDSHRSLVDVLVLATLKADAVARIEQLGFGDNVELRITQSTWAAAIVQAGLLKGVGDAVFFLSAQHERPIASARAGSTTLVHAADWRCDRSTGFQLVVEIR